MYIAQSINMNILQKNGYNGKVSVNLYGFKTNNNIFLNRFDNKIFFGAGWTPEIEESIRNCNIKEISQNLIQLGIETDFRENKIIAWCCDKAVEIINQLNKKHKLGLILPKAIYVEDFSKLNIDNEKIYGFCNWVPAHVLKDSDKVFPERTLFFNSMHQWENIDQVAELSYKSGRCSSPHFLSRFFHELGHSCQNGNLLKSHTLQQLSLLVKKLTSKECCIEYQRKFRDITTKISREATDNPLETIAEDIARKISEALNPKLSPTYNPFQSSFYLNKGIFISLVLPFRIATEEEKVERRLLKQVWNGKDFL